MALVKPLIIRNGRRAQLGETSETITFKVVSFVVTLPNISSGNASYSVTLPYSCPVGTDLLCTARGTTARWFIARARVTATVGNTSTVAVDVWAFQLSGSLSGEQVTVKVYAAVR